MAMLLEMTELLEQLAQTLTAALRLVWLWLGQPGINPLAWSGATWALVGIAALFLSLLVPYRPVRLRSRRPNILISKGSLEQMKSSSLQKLNFTISNLGDTPVQLLELALQTNLSSPVLVEAVELLAPYEVVELEAPLTDELIGDAGKLHVVAFAAAARGRLYSLKAKLVWEPRHKRFRISPVGQRLRRAHRLTSARLEDARKQAWSRQSPHLGQAAPVKVPAQPDPKKTAVARRRKPLELDFPTEF